MGPQHSKRPEVRRSFTVLDMCRTYPTLEGRPTPIGVLVDQRIESGCCLTQNSIHPPKQSLFG